MIRVEFNEVREAMSDRVTCEHGSRSSAHANEAHFRYSVYGISVISEIELCLPECGGANMTEIEVLSASDDVFATALGDVRPKCLADWYFHCELRDGSSYVRWTGVGQFLVSSDGRKIWCLRDVDSSPESFQVYLVGQALSFALTKRGLEPLHATVLVTNGVGFALLGESGFGKSTLAASFIAAGHSLLTDDQLVLAPSAEDLIGYPGPARLKLFPDIAQRFLGGAAAGVPMNLDTNKLIIPLERNQRFGSPVPVVALYCITAPEAQEHGSQVEIEALVGREAFLAIASNTFNRRIVDPQRMKRQIFATREIIMRAAVRKLAYPRQLDYLPSVQEAILSDLASLRQPRTWGHAQL